MRPGPVRDEVLLLRCIALGDTSLIVSALSASRGKIRLVAKGAKTPRSRFIGLLDPGNEIEAIYYPRENRELWTLSDAALRRAALTGAASLDKLSHLFAALELGDRMLGELDAAAEYEPHFRQFLDTWHLGEDPEMASLFFALELQILQESGWGIDVQRCGQCSRELDEGRASWSVADGQLVCASCATGGGRWIDVHALLALQRIDALRRWVPQSREDLDAFPGGLDLGTGPRRAVGRLLHEHMAFHLPRYRLPRSLYWLQEAAAATAAEAR
jgi:DNA repair protein RecO (recombination protein O)